MTLKPCPFCGGTDLCVDQFGLEKFGVSCESADCGAIGPERKTKDDAIEAWNAELKR